MTDNVDFHSVGGLEQNVQYLKDAILLPWMHRDVLKTFNMKPARGILFHGPPGTGKTLTARALANECKRNKKKVSFFHQDGAQCLDMWLGESERKLRELFKTAQLNRPAIIFFDELDSVAPIRSVRMDHVHSSVVSTLLTLMDGLKSAPDVVVIGATNRLDEIDRALRRPGRFDKELFFPPPDLEARRTILNIHTKHWNINTSSEFMDHLAEQTVGYCGADLQGLCREALTCAIKRSTSLMQKIRAKDVMVVEDDFVAAKSKFVPSYLRSSITPVRSLSEVIRPLLQSSVGDVMQQLEENYPYKFIFPKQRSERKDKLLFCPRILLTGSADQELTSDLAPAILHKLEQLPAHLLDVTTLCINNNLSDCGSIEAVMAQRLKVVKLQQPCILYLPDITEWWSLVEDMVKSIFLRVINDFDSSTEVLLLATAHLPFSELPESLKDIFNERISLIVTLKDPTEVERRKFFEPLFSVRNLQKENPNLNTEDLESAITVQNEARKANLSMPGVQTRSWSQGSIEHISLDNDLKDGRRKGQKRRLHETKHCNKKTRTGSPQPSTSYGSAYQRHTQEDLPLSEEGRLLWTNPAEGSEVMREEKIRELQERLIRATKNKTVRHLKTLHNELNMALMRHKYGKNCPSFEEDLEDIITQCERENLNEVE